MNAAMIVCIDVQYHDKHAVAACVGFEQWSTAEPSFEVTCVVQPIADYVPGEFYRRELPCIMAVLDKVDAEVTTVVVDGYVWLTEGKPGLGAYLYKALNESLPIVGVAKNRFRDDSASIELFRGMSKNPLYVTATGIDADRAAKHIASMHGPHRIPTLLKRADRLCRTSK